MCGPVTPVVAAGFFAANWTPQRHLAVFDGKGQATKPYKGLVRKQSDLRKVKVVEAMVRVFAKFMISTISYNLFKDNSAASN